MQADSRLFAVSVDCFECYRIRLIFSWLLPPEPFCACAISTARTPTAYRRQWYRYVHPT